MAFLAERAGAIRLFFFFFFCSLLVRTYCSSLKLAATFLKRDRIDRQRLLIEWPHLSQRNIRTPNTRRRNNDQRQNTNCCNAILVRTLHCCSFRSPPD